MSNLRRLLMRHASSSIGLVAPMRKANCEIGDVLLYDRNLQRPCILKASRFTKTQVEALDTTRYFNTKAVYFGKEEYPNGGSCKGLWIAPESAGRTWARDNYYTLTPGSSCFSGGVLTKELKFDITIVGGSTSTGALSITAATGSSIADIALLIHNAKQNISGAKEYIAVGTFKESASASVTAIGIRAFGWSSNAVSIANIKVDGVADSTGLVLDDFSWGTKYNGSLVSAVSNKTHRSYQGSYVNSLWSSYGLTGFKWPGNSTANYARNGRNLGYWAGGNFSRFKTYVKGSGGTTVVDDVDGSTAPMNYATWQSIKDPNSQYYNIYSKYLTMYNAQSESPQKSWIEMYGTPTADETEGPYDLYVMSRMMDTEWMENNTSGMINLFFRPKTDNYQHDGVTGTTTLALFTTDGFSSDGSAGSGSNAFVLATDLPCYPAAEYSYSYAPANLPVAATDMAAHKWNLATGYQVSLFLRDDIKSKIEASWVKVSAGSTLPVTSGYNYWSLSEYYHYTAWSYHGIYGRFGYYYRYISLTCRSVLALDLPS